MPAEPRQIGVLTSSVQWLNPRAIFYPRARLILSVARGGHKDGTWKGSGEEGGSHTFLGFLHDLLCSFPPNELPLEADLAFLIL